MSFKNFCLFGLLLACLLTTGRNLGKPVLADFYVYDTAASLVRQHRSGIIYDGADTGQDPQLKFANPESPFGRAADRLGIKEVRLYVYPPLLADLLVPFSLLPASTGGILWFLTNCLALCLIFGLIVALMKQRRTWIFYVALGCGLVSFYPISIALNMGQITIGFELLWIIGVLSYERKLPALSALAFALAAAIKLTPLIVLIPFLIWKDWRWVKAFALWLLIIVGVTMGVNGPGAIVDFARHVIPAMASGIPDLDNHSVLSSIQVLYQTWDGTSRVLGARSVPNGVLLLGKLIGCAVLIIAFLGIYRSRGDKSSRGMVLALLAMLSVAVSPVSWTHAYVLCLLPLCLLWDEVYLRKTSVGYQVFLSVTSVQIACFLISFVLIKHVHGLGIGLVSLLAPGAAIALALGRIWKYPFLADSIEA